MVHRYSAILFYVSLVILFLGVSSFGSGSLTEEAKRVWGHRLTQENVLDYIPLSHCFVDGYVTVSAYFGYHLLTKLGVLTFFLAAKNTALITVGTDTHSRQDLSAICCVVLIDVVIPTLTSSTNDCMQE